MPLLFVLILGCILVPLAGAVLANFPKGVSPSIGYLIVLVLVSAVINSCFFVALRLTWSWGSSRSTSFRQIMLGAIAMGAIASFLFLGPLWLVDDGCAFPPQSRQLAHPTMISSIARFIAYFNTVDVVAAYSFFAIALLLLVHRAIWPHLRKPVTVVRLAGIMLTRTRLYSIGIVLILLATGKAYEWAMEFVDNAALADKIKKLLQLFGQ